MNNDETITEESKNLDILDESDMIFEEMQSPIIKSYSSKDKWMMLTSTDEE